MKFAEGYHGRFVPYSDYSFQHKLRIRRELFRSMRKFWQIHLSTALLSMLLTGALLGLNVVEREAAPQYPVAPLSDYSMLKTWGWPYRLGERGVLKPHASCSFPPGVIGGVRADEEHRLCFSVGLEPNLALKNGVACAALVLVVAVLCELFIRRSELKRAAIASRPSVLSSSS